MKLFSCRSSQPRFFASSPFPIRSEWVPAQASPASYSLGPINDQSHVYFFYFFLPAFSSSFFALFFW
jgi:hypothetical protein